MQQQATAGRGPRSRGLANRRPVRHPARVGNNRQRLANLVKAWRIQLGMLSQAALAEASQVSIRTVGSLERGEKISPTKMRQIEMALRRPPYTFDAILEGVEPASPQAEPWALALAEMSEAEVDRLSDIVEAYRAGEGERFKLWARGVRDAARRGIEPRNVG